MLSRVADSLYWMGRYLERAENVARLVLVASETAVELEGLSEDLAQAEWDELLATVGAAPGGGLEFSREKGLSVPYVKRLLVDESDPASIGHAIACARENARSVREALTREVFSDLNEAHRGLQRLRRRGLRDAVDAREEVARAHRAVLQALGSIEHTLTRDQGWTFLKLGEAMERTQRTLVTLQVKLPSLGVGTGRDLPVFYARWRGLLRAVASLENYRAARGADPEPQQVLRFLLFHPSAPRSVFCGVSRIRRYLDQLPSGEQVSEADRLLGRLHAELRYDDDAILAKGDLAAWCGETAGRLALAHDALARQYFPG